MPWAVTQRFGVPAEILVSIWGNESSFGQVQGDKDVIRSLATLAFDGRRRDWAEGQLKDALDIVIDGRRDRAGLRGSWAGAMGQTQFMPDNYLRLGVDQNARRPGRYLGHRCRRPRLRRQPAGPGRLEARSGLGLRGRPCPPASTMRSAEADGRPWSFWAQRGVTLARGGAPSSDEAAENGVILLPQGARGPAFLALPNHYVIRRYNNSVSYALAIGLTADGIAGKPGLVGDLARRRPDLARAAVRRPDGAGPRWAYDPGGIDGVVGSGTRRALRQWQIANGRIADGYLTAALADELMRGR